MQMTSKSPSIEVPGSLMIPGMASIATKTFEPLVTALSKQGISGFEPLNLPSINPQVLPEPNGLEADAAVIRSRLIEEIEGKGRDVFLLLHSYGGAPGLSATTGLWKSTREKQGKKGGILKAICIAASISLPGESRFSAMSEYIQKGGSLDLPAADIEVTPQGPIINKTGCRAVFFNDLPPNLADHWDSTLASTSMSSLASPVPPDSTNPREWDIAFLQPSQDLGMPIEYLDYAIRRARDAGAHVDEEVGSVDAGHFCWLGRPEETVRWVAGVVKENMR